MLPHEQRHELPEAYPLPRARVLLEHAGVPRGILDLARLDRGTQLTLAQPLDRLRRRYAAQILKLDLSPVRCRYRGHHP